MIAQQEQNLLELNKLQGIRNIWIWIYFEPKTLRLNISNCFWKFCILLHLSFKLWSCKVVSWTKSIAIHWVSFLLTNDKCKELIKGYTGSVKNSERFENSFFTTCSKGYTYLFIYLFIIKTKAPKIYPYIWVSLHKMFHVRAVPCL